MTGAVNCSFGMRVIAKLSGLLVGRECFKLEFTSI
jgi:hypothetical protein